MNLNLRQMKLAKLLMEQDNKKTIEYYADVLVVSKRTISDDLKLVEPFLKSRGFKIEKTPGLGIEINKTEKNILITNHENNFDLQLTPKMRQLEIMKFLLFESKNITYQKLSEKFLVSVSSIKNDLNVIRKKYFDEYTATLESDFSGTKLLGNEFQIRNVYLLFNSISISEIYLNDKTEYWIEFLKQTYGNKTVNACLHAIDEIKQSGIVFIGHHYKMNLLSTLTVILYRVSKGYNIAENTDIEMTNLDNTTNLLLAKDILSKIENKIHIQFTSNESEYLLKHLIANRVSYIIPNLLEDSKISYLSKEIIREMSNVLDIDLNDSVELFNYIFSHIKPMLYRLQNGINIVNPLIEMIKTEFAVIFNLLWLVLDSLFDELGVELTEDEIGFLVLYFQVAIEKKHKSKLILVVCPAGISTSNLIVTRLRMILPPADIIEVSSIEKMKEKDLSNIDLIISTTPIDTGATPCLVVSTLINENDLQKISNFYNKNFVFNYSSSLDFSSVKLNNYLPDTLVFLNRNLYTKKEVIDFMSEQLEKQGYVTKEFRDSVYHREQIGSTETITGAAIPHGKIKNVKKSVLGLYVSNQGIKWEKYFVRVIFFVCVNEKNTNLARYIMKSIFKIVSEKREVTYISQMQSKSEIINYLEEH